MNERDDEKQSLSEVREVEREWMPAASLAVFFISTTVLDARIMLASGPRVLIAFVLGLMSLQGYTLWYYFKRLRPESKGTLIAAGYYRLFAIAMIGTTVVALVGIYAITVLLRNG